MKESEKVKIRDQWLLENDIKELKESLDHLCSNPLVIDIDTYSYQELIELYICALDLFNVTWEHSKRYYGIKPIKN